MFGYPLVAEPRRTFTTFFAALLTILTIVSSGLRASAQTVDVNKETDLSVAEFYLPTLAKKFPPGRQTSCPAKCKGAQDKLNKLWHKLYIHDYATLAELRPWHTAVEKSNSSAENTVHAKLVKKYGKSFTIHDLEGELETILADIAFAAYDLEQCEKKCNQAGQPPSVTGTPPPTPPPQPPTATGVKLPPPPGKCASDAELKAYQQQLDNIKSDLQGKRRGLLKNQSATDKEDPNYDLFQKEIDKIDKDLKQVNDLLDKADAELKKPQAERTKIAMCLPPTEKTGDGTPGQLRGFGYVSAPR